ncbi:MAG: LamG domain-containing protein, partial [Clostridiales Family XIII bacterium]|nr:LamG domain-containing protein [Clostridiales Family XIII bacterium]
HGGYITNGLIAQFDGIYNAVDDEGDPTHKGNDALVDQYTYKQFTWENLAQDNPDMTLYFTNTDSTADRILGDSINFTSENNPNAIKIDYGEIANSTLISALSSVTVEVCFQQDINNNYNKICTLYSYSRTGNSSYTGTFGEYINTNQMWTLSQVVQDNIFTPFNMGGANTNFHTNYTAISPQPNKFVTHSNAFSLETSEYARRAWIDGIRTQLFDATNAPYTSPIQGNEPTSDRAATFNAGTGSGDKDFNLAMNIGEGSASQNYPFSGQIASVRIYNRQLTDAEVAKNAAIDNYRFN